MLTTLLNDAYRMLMDLCFSALAVDELEQVKALPVTGQVTIARKKMKLLQQELRRLKVKLKSAQVELTEATGRAVCQDDMELLQLVKEADKIITSGLPRFHDVFKNLARAVVNGKMHTDSIETEYFAQLSANLSQTFANNFRYSDNLMRFFSALSKLQSGRACLGLLRSKSTEAAESSAAISAPFVKDLSINFHVPSENSINAWDMANDIDPGFVLGISKPIIEHILRTTEGILRIACDATDCHGAARYLAGGKFEGGDVTFPGSKYDAAKLEEEYRKLALPVEKFAADPPTISSANRAERRAFAAACAEIKVFLQKGRVYMVQNRSALCDKVERLRTTYQKRQQNKADKKKASTMHGRDSAAAPAKASKKKAEVEKKSASNITQTIQPMEDEDELNAQQNTQLAKTRQQIASADLGIQRVTDFLTEAEAESPVQILVAGTVLQGLQAYYSSIREIASKIFEVRICDLSPEASGISNVIARFLLDDSTNVEKMQGIRSAIMKTLSEYTGISQRLELESCDGEHFQILWQLAEAPQTAYELWDQNVAEIDTLETELLEKGGHKAKGVNAQVHLRTEYFGVFVRRFGLVGAFTIHTLPRAKTEISEAVQRMGLGCNDTKASLSYPKHIYGLWSCMLDRDQTRYGSDYGTAGHDATGAYKVSEIQKYLHLRHVFKTQPAVGYLYFKDAVLEQNFSLLAKRAQSSSRLSMLKEKLASSIPDTLEPSLDSESALEESDKSVLSGSSLKTVEEILDVLAGAESDLQAIGFLMEMLPVEALEEVCDIYKTLRYSEGVWLPQRDRDLGKTLCKHEDFFHKLKRVTSSVRSQKAAISGDGRRRTVGPPLLDKTKLLEIAYNKPVEHSVIIHALEGKSSDPMDPFAQSRMFVSQTFYNDVRAKYPDLALCLKTIGEWYDAQDKTGLSETERAKRLSNMHDLFYAVIGRYWYCHTLPPSNIAGMPLRLWFALNAIVDSARVLIQVKLGGEFHPSAGQGGSSAGKKRMSEPFTEQPFKRPKLDVTACQAEEEKKHSNEGKALTGHTGKTLRGQKLAWGSYTHKTVRLIKTLRRQLIKLRYSGTYDLEGGFSALVTIVGYKPAIQVALGVLRRAQILSSIRALPSRGFHFPKSSRAHYDYAVHRRQRGMQLAHEWFGTEGFVRKEVSKRDEQRARPLMKEPAVHVRDFSKRTSKKTGEALVA